MLLKKAFVNDDDHLRTGFVAFTILCVIIFIISIGYKIKESSENTIVNVQHTFKAKKEVPVKKSKSPLPKVDEKINNQTVEKNESGLKELQTVKKEPVHTQLKEKQNQDVPAKQLSKSYDKPKKQIARNELVNNKLSEKQLLPPEKKLRKNHSSDILQVDKDHHSITVSKNLYQKIHHNWMSSMHKGNQKMVSLNVENLSNVYPLFQMKPVVVVGEKFIDLTEGFEIDENSLDEYSDIVFNSGDPYTDWGRRLSALGIKPSDNLLIRYYMYPFIKRMFNSNAIKAYQCCINKGQLEPSTKILDIEIYGKTYIINRDGTGRIGIFLPVSIHLHGKIIKVNPHCFDDQIEFQTLMDSGCL